MQKIPELEKLYEEIQIPTQTPTLKSNEDEDIEWEKSRAKAKQRFQKTLQHQDLMKNYIMKYIDDFNMFKLEDVIQFLESMKLPYGMGMTREIRPMPPDQFRKSLDKD